MRRLTHETLRDYLNERLAAHISLSSQDPQTNPVKLLAYDLSKKVEDREVAFRDIETFIKTLSDKAAVERAERLGDRAGLNKINNILKDIKTLALQRAEDGFDAFKKWLETPAQGIVLTAHPTFSLSRDIRECLGTIADKSDSSREDAKITLATLPYLPKRAPSLQEEHEDAQAAIQRIQNALQDTYKIILNVARDKFPDQWTDLTPLIVSVYSWVGYDIDGRTDITWADAIRLRLQEKFQQLVRYAETAEHISGGAKGISSLETLTGQLKDAQQSAARDLALFNEDLSDPSKLVDAANNCALK